jgi:hypothetical protein
MDCDIDESPSLVFALKFDDFPSQEIYWDST